MSLMFDKVINIKSPTVPCEYEEGDILVTTKPCNHGDVKTRVAKPDKYPRLPKGTTCEFVKQWENFYGTWVRVVTYWGQTYDLPPDALEKQKPTVE